MRVMLLGAGSVSHARTDEGFLLCAAIVFAPRTCIETCTQTATAVIESAYNYVDYSNLRRETSNNRVFSQRQKAFCLHKKGIDLIVFFCWNPVLVSARGPFATSSLLARIAASTNLLHFACMSW
jgi:hypothetical protein